MNFFLINFIKRIKKGIDSFNHQNCNKNQIELSSTDCSTSQLIGIIIKKIKELVNSENKWKFKWKFLSMWLRKRIFLQSTILFRLSSKFKLIFIIILIACTPHLSNSFHHNTKYSMNVVKTKYGPIRGIVVRTEPLVEAYLGVPYASPPVGSLRFMPPVTPSTWKNVRLADRFSPVCPQSVPVPPNGPEALLEVPRGRLAQLRKLLPLLTNQSEDCLYLNLYVSRAFNPGSASPPSPTNYEDDANLSSGSPKPDSSSSSSKLNSGRNSGTTFTNGAFSDLNDDPRNKALATIVYIHGESYEWNSGNPYDGSVLAAHGNVIVVTVNFRLGILGFLKTGGKGSAQGNFGLMDLVAGLHWLRENLPSFGGDPNKVTIMGHGTGAALANILIVSPVASDLIHRAILLSGSALSPWAIQKDPLYVKRRVAEQTGCHGDLLVDDLAPCLRTKPIEQLLQVKIDSPRFLPGFAPFIDGTVIAHASVAPSGPLTLPVGSAIASTSGIELADFPTRELVFGLTTIESYLDLSAQDLEFGFNETRRDRILRTYVRNVYHYHLNEIYAALKNEYTDWERPVRNPLGSRDASLEFLSDGHTAAPLIRLGYLHSLRGGRTYFLHFRHQSGERDFPQRGGSVHGEDVPFGLGLPISPLFPYNYTKQDIKISRTMIRYISNFAQTGNPNETPATSVDISRLVHSKSSLTSSSLTLGSSVSSSLQKTTFGESQKNGTKKISLSDGKINSETLSTLLPPSHSNDQQHQHLLSKPHSLASLSLKRNLDDRNIQSDSTSMMSFTSSSPFVRSSALSMFSSMPSAITSLAPRSLIASRNSPDLTKKIMQKNKNNYVSGGNSGRVVVELPSLTAKKSKRHIVTLSAFSYATENHNRDISSVRADMTSRSFKRRKRKISKHSKRKNLPPHGISIGIPPTSENESSSNSNSNNNSIFYRKRYSLPTKSSLEMNRHQSIDKLIRYSMQNDQQGIDEEEDDENENDDNENDNGIDEDEEDDEDDEELDRGNENNHNQRLDSRDEDEVNEKFDRFSDDLIYNRLPFWDTYDAINQLYLDLGNKVEIRNHYRGHKLSMWLSLIPQLHSPGDLNELPMRHHHFPEDSAQYYDGIIRPQIMQRPNFPKSNVHQQQQQQQAIGSTTSTTQRNDLAGEINLGSMPILTTECPPNTTIVPTIAATRPQNHGSGNISSGAGGSKTITNNNQIDNNLLRRTASSQYQNYTTALLVTISVGCFLLLLNILIFAGIYYQREKRLTDAKKKEELCGEAERCAASSPNLEKLGRGGGASNGGKIGSRKSSLQSLTGYNSSGSFGEYSCYDEKLQCKEKHSLADICSVELPLKEFKSSSPNTSNMGSLRRNTSISPQQNQSGLLIYPPSYHNNNSSNNNTLTQTQNHYQQKQLHQYATAAAVAIVEHQSSSTLSPAPATVSSPSPPKTTNINNSNSLVTYSQYHKQSQQNIHHQHHWHHSQMDTNTSPNQVSYGSQTIKNSTIVGTSTEQCNQSTQSDQPDVLDVGTSADEKTIVVIVSGNSNPGVSSCTSPGKSISTTQNKQKTFARNIVHENNKNDNEDDEDNEDDDKMISPGIPEPPPPPKSSAPYQGGILRQPGPATTPGSNKKRVQIQEISV